MKQFFQKIRLRRIAKLHEKWLDTDHKKGRRAVITGMTFINYRMPGYNLEGAIFKNCRFENVDFCNLRHSDARFIDCRLFNCYFTIDCLMNITFKRCTIKSSVFNNSKLDGVKFKNCYLDLSMFLNTKIIHCDIVKTTLDYANFTGAELYDVNIDQDCVLYTTVGLSFACPEEGEFIAFKKVMVGPEEYGIAKLKVPADAKRSSATSRKCRVSEAKVLAITSIDGNTAYKTARSTHCHEFKYVVGKTVTPDKFDDDRWNECSNGIHCFISRLDAANY